MRGRIHNLVVYEALGTYTRDSEGHATPDYQAHPTRGHIAVPDDKVRLDFASQTGDEVDTEALIDKSIPVARSSLVRAVGTGNTLLDGTYRVVSITPNRWHTRVMLARYEV